MMAVICPESNLSLWRRLADVGVARGSLNARAPTGRRKNGGTCMKKLLVHPQAEQESHFLGNGGNLDGGNGKFSSFEGDD